MSTTKTAATRLVDTTHTQLTARAEAAGKSVSEYLEELVLRDLDAGAERRGEAAGEESGPLPAGALEVIRKDLAQQRELTNKLGELVYGTRVAFFNYAILWVQVASGKVDLRTFDWQRWAEENLVQKPKPAGGSRAEHRDASSQ